MRAANTMGRVVYIAQSASICRLQIPGGERKYVSNIHDLTERAVTEASEDSRVLRYFDPYGTLILNAKQMDDFLADWEEAKRLIASDLDQRTWDEVQALALLVRESNTDFLCIEGD
jgi:hypothetical protein